MSEDARYLLWLRRVVRALELRQDSAARLGEWFPCALELRYARDRVRELAAALIGAGC